jgi:RNA-splicing ligase RtcB
MNTIRIDGRSNYGMDRKWFSEHVRDLACRNLGTLGGGNHFIEIQAGDDNHVWLMIHGNIFLYC